MEQDIVNNLKSRVQKLEDELLKVVGKVHVYCICDLSCENVPNGIRSNGRTHGKRTDEKRVGKPFETDKANG